MRAYISKVGDIGQNSTSSGQRSSRHTVHRNAPGQPLFFFFALFREEIGLDREKSETILAVFAVSRCIAAHSRNRASVVFSLPGLLHLRIRYNQIDVVKERFTFPGRKRASVGAAPIRMEGESNDNEIRTGV